MSSFGSNARLGQGEYLVAEADESDGSFLKLTPTIAVVTTIDAEHLDHYENLEHIREAFTAFVSKVPFYGSAVLCLDQPNIQMLMPTGQPSASSPTAWSREPTWWRAACASRA